MKLLYNAHNKDIEKLLTIIRLLTYVELVHGIAQ